MGIDAVLDRLRAEMDLRKIPSAEWGSVKRLFDNEMASYVKKHPERPVSAVAHAYETSIVYIDELAKTYRGYNGQL